MAGDVEWRSDRGSSPSGRGTKTGSLLLVVVLVATACSGGGDDDSSAKDSRPRSTSTTAVDPLATLDRYTTGATPIGTLVKDPAALAVLKKHVPQFISGSKGFLDLIADTPLKGIQGYGASVLTDQVLAAIDADLAKLTPLPGARLVADVNYDEDLVASYVLPDPLVLANGRRVKDKRTWLRKRRPEILRSFEELVYGRVPRRPVDEHFEVTESATPAFAGAAVRKQVRIFLSGRADGPDMDLVEYVPAAATGPVPMLLVLGFGSTTAMFGDPDLSANSGSQPTLPDEAGVGGPQADVAALLRAGFGVAGINYLQLDPDRKDGYEDSVRAFFDGGTEADRKPDAWGAIAAWGWGLSRAQDYLETDPKVDSDRVAIYGASRLGRGVLWAAARDQRFAAVVSCCSGKLGASLLRRNFGETIGTLDSVYYVAPNMADYDGDDLDSLPVDSHMLLALIAPRPALLQEGKYDHGADPKGSFLAAVAAEPVYKMLGARGLDVSESAWPPDKPILNDLGFILHDGGHGTLPEDWKVIVDFLVDHLAHR